VRFIVDAQLPYTLCALLRWKGLDCIHTDDLPEKEKTTDEEIRQISVSDNRIVITKDSDFLDSHLVKGVPPKLLMVATGNIVNKKLLEIFDKNISEILTHFQSHKLVELDNFDITVFE
jgi:predicted nuclease of predicted toxin-antitoxin system